MINYQGRLTDSGNSAVTGTYTMTFRLYDAATSGTELWEEQQTVTLAEADSGIFNVVLGAVEGLSSVNFNNPIWLSVQVADDSEMTPRQRLTAVGYAMNADQLDGLDSTKFLRTDADTSTSGKLTLTKSGTALLIKPSSDPAANTALVDVQNAAGTSKFNVDLEGDTATAGNATVAGNLTVSGTISGTLSGSSGMTGTTSTTWTVDSDATGTEPANGAGFVIEGGSGDVTLGWDATNDHLALNKDFSLSAQKALRFADADSSNYMALKAPASVSSNITWTLPSADATVSGQALTSDAAGTLAWTTVDTSTADDAPTSASYLTLGTDATLSAERVLTEGNYLDLTDAGANGALTVAMDPTEVGSVTWGTTGATWTFATGATNPTIAWSSGALDIDANITVDDLACETAGCLSATELGADSVDTSELVATGVTAASYGTSSAVPTIAVDADGRITSASNTTIVVTDAGAGTTSTTFTINSDNSAAAVAAGTGIVFDGGSGTDKSILWDATNTEFDFNDDLNLTGDVLIDTTGAANLAASGGSPSLDNRTATESLAIATDPTATDSDGVIKLGRDSSEYEYIWYDNSARSGAGEFVFSASQRVESSSPAYMLFSPPTASGSTPQPRFGLKFDPEASTKTLTFLQVNSPFTVSDELPLFEFAADGSYSVFDSSGNKSTVISSGRQWQQEFENVIFNGSFEAFSGGTSETGSASGTNFANSVMDGWSNLGGATVTRMYAPSFGYSNNLNVKFGYAAVKIEDSGATNAQGVQQEIEPFELRELRGKQVTMSVFAKKGGTGTLTNAALLGYEAWGENGTSVGSGTKQATVSNTDFGLIDYTFTVPATTYRLFVRLYGADATAGANTCNGACGGIIYDGVTLVQGSMIAPFKSTPIKDTGSQKLYGDLDIAKSGVSTDQASFGVSSGGNLNVGGKLHVSGGAEVIGGSLTLGQSGAQGGIWAYPMGAHGTTPYKYVVTSLDTSSIESLAREVFVPDGPDPLTSTNKIRIEWSPASNSTYVLYGRKPDGTFGCLRGAAATCADTVALSATSFEDTGTAGTGTPNTLHQPPAFSGAAFTPPGSITMQGGLRVGTGGTPNVQVGSSAVNPGNTYIEGNLQVGGTIYGTVNGGTNGTVTSVGLSAPPEFTVSNSPVTGAGTLTLTKVNQNPNLVYAGPASGGAAAPAFRGLLDADIPDTITIANSTNWDTAYTDRLKWDGGATGLVAATGRTSLGLGTIATQAADSVAITGGSINNTPIGASTASTGKFTTLTTTSDTDLGGLMTASGTNPVTTNPPPYSFLVDEATTNLVPNPSFDDATVGTASWAAVGTGAIARVTTPTPYIGAGAGNITGSADGDGAETSPPLAVSASTTYTASVFVRHNTSGTIKLSLIGNNSGATDSAAFTGSVVWRRYTVTKTTNVSDTTLTLRIKASGVQTLNIFADAVQLEQKVSATSYADGSLGPGYTWSGTAHNSSSSRTAGMKYLGGPATAQPVLYVAGNAYFEGGSGDTSGTNGITLSDVTKVGQYLAGIFDLTPAEMARADVNGDGRVTWEDRNAINLMVFGTSKYDAVRQLNNVAGATSATMFTVTQNLDVDGTITAGSGGGAITDTTGNLILRGQATSCTQTAEGEVCWDTDNDNLYVGTAAGAQLVGGSSSGTGSVTSVGLALPSELTVTNSPVTASGTLTGAWANQTTNKVLAAPNGSTGTPIFRALVDADIPDNITIANSANWDTAYTDRLKWDGGATGLVAATGRTSLDLGSIATQNANSVAITGGTINGATIGASTASTGAFTTLTASSTAAVTGAATFSNNITENAAAPTLKGSVVDATYLAGAEDVYVLGKYAYVIANVPASTSDRFTIVDIANPASPVVKGSLASTNFDGPGEVMVVGRYAYVTGQTADRLSIIDISNPNSPSIVGSITSASLDGARALWVSGRYAYVGAKTSNLLAVIDVANPSALVMVGSVQDNVKLSNINEITGQGKYLYTVTYDNDFVLDDYFTVIDVSNPASPSIAGSLLSPTANNEYSYAEGIAVSGKYVYSGNYGAAALEITDVSNPASPVLVSSTSTAFFEGGLAFADRYVYAMQAGSLQVISVSDPSSPASLVTYNTGGTGGSSVFVAGRYAYLTDATQNKLYIMSLTGLDAPAVNAGAVSAYNLDIYGNAQVANDLSVGNSLSVGAGGILSAGDVTVMDGKLLDLSKINASSTTEGLKLPQTTSCVAGTAEGQICWDTDNDALYVGNSAGVTAIGAGGGGTVTSVGSGSGLTGGPITGSGTLSLGPLTADWNQTGAFDLALNNASSELKILEAGASPTLFGIFDIADLATADKTYTFPNATGTVLTTGNLTDITGTGTLTSGATGAGFTLALGSSTVTGTLADANVSDTLTASLFVGSGSTTTAVDLATAEVAGTLPAASVGTGSFTITGGTINNTPIGATTANTGAFTTMTAGDATNKSMFSSSGALTYAGTARPLRTIVLTPNSAIAASGEATHTLSGTNFKYYTLDYAATGASNDSFWEFLVPDSFDASTTTVSITLYWTGGANCSAGLCEVVWEVAMDGKATGAAFDAALQTAVNTGAASANGTAGVMVATSALTPTSGWNNGELAVVRISRLGDNAADDLGTTAKLIMAKIEWYAAAESD